MLLAIDIGNTSTKLGCFLNNKLALTHNLKTQEINESSIKNSLLKIADKFPKPTKRIKGICISSVVPHLDKVIASSTQSALNAPVLFVSHKTASLKTSIRNPEKIGADRIANIVAAYAKYAQAAIVIDFGTATTFDYVNNNGEFIGGVITPGIQVFNEILPEKTSKLPKTDLIKTKKIIGQDTVESMQAGIFHGYIGLVNNILDKIRKETKNKKIKVILTGGFSKIISKSINQNVDIIPSLTLEGINIIWNENYCS